MNAERKEKEKLNTAMIGLVITVIVVLVAPTVWFAARLDSRLDNIEKNDLPHIYLELEYHGALLEAIAEHLSKHDAEFAAAVKDAKRRYYEADKAMRRHRLLNASGNEE